MKNLKKVFIITFLIILFCSVIVIVCYKEADKFLNDKIDNIKSTSNEANNTTGENNDKTSNDDELTDTVLLELADIVTADVKGAQVTYNAEKAINIILKNDVSIANMAKQLNMPKSFLQTILLKELSTQNAMDTVADTLVEKYYEEVEKNGYSDKKSDSSTGYGQIFAVTAITSYNTLVTSGIIDGKKLADDDISVRKDVWYKLKDDKEYNIKNVAYAIKANAVYKGYKDLNNCSDAQRKKLFASYNGSGATATEYGKIAAKYYEKFEEYNNK